MPKSRIKIRGNDRGLMFLARDVRRRWMQYGESRKVALDNSTFDDSPDGKIYYVCNVCNTLLKKEEVEIDHTEAVGKRPRKPDQFSDYIKRMFYIECQVLCKRCHAKKSKKDRKAIKQNI